MGNKKHERSQNNVFFGAIGFGKVRIVAGNSEILKKFSTQGVVKNMYKHYAVSTPVK